MVGKASPIPSSPGHPLVDRTKEREELAGALGRAVTGDGSAWVLEGPGGIGKTRLAKWVAEEAEKRGFHVAWGYSQKDVISPFFPFQQIFRTLESGPSTPGIGPQAGITVYEEAKGDAFWRDLAKLCQTHRTLIINREKPEATRRRLPNLPESTQILWLRRGGEGPDVVSPTELDMLGEKLSSHLSGEGSPAVALSGTEYLVSQSNFLPVLRLIQFLRDSAEAVDGMVLISVNPLALEKREMALLEGEGTVVREERDTSSAARVEAEPPATVMMHYLENLEKMAFSRPVLLIVDNIQWADGNSLHTFQFLARNLRNSNVLILATQKTDEDVRGETAQALDEVMDQMVREGTVHRRALHTLSAEDSRKVAEDLVGGPIAVSSGGDQFRRLIGRMGGNPYFIQATVQMLIEEGRLKREAGEAVLSNRGEGEDDLPESLKKAVVRRLSTLTERERSLLQAAALVGQEFDVPPVAAAVGLIRDEVYALLTRVEEVGRFVQRMPGSSSRWDFQETLTREVILSEMPPQDLKVLSTSLTTWWERNRLEDVDTLARLYHSAGEPAKGLPFMRKAIQRAITDQLPEKVDRYHRWLQDTLAQQSTPREDRLREGLAIVNDCYIKFGTTHSLLRILENLEEIGAGPPLSLERTAWTALMQSRLNPKLARVTYEALEREFTAAPQNVTHQAEALRYDTAMYFARNDGRYEDVMQLGQKLLDMAERDGTRRLAVVSLYHMGWAQYALGHTQEAMEVLRRLRDTIAAGEPPAEMIKVTNLEGVLHAEVGDLQAAVASFQEAIDLARKHGQIYSLISNLLNLSQAKGELGQFEAQEALARETLGLARSFNLSVPVAMTDLGRALNRQERYKEALVILTQSAALIKKEGAHDMVAPCLVNMAEAHLGLEDLPAAMVEITDVEKHLGTLHAYEEYGRFYGLKARILAARGDKLKAQEVIEEGLSQARSKGNKLQEAMLLKEMERLK